MIILKYSEGHKWQCLLRSDQRLHDHRSTMRWQNSLSVCHSGAQSLFHGAPGQGR